MGGFAFLSAQTNSAVMFKAVLAQVYRLVVCIVLTVYCTSFFCFFVALLSSTFSSYLLYLSLSFTLCVAVVGTMANHLISNALLRPHGTNPYNTLLGESAVYNNPTANMFNTQGLLHTHRTHWQTLWDCDYSKKKFNWCSTKCFFHVMKVTGNILGPAML